MVVDDLDPNAAPDAPRPAAAPPAPPPRSVAAGDRDGWGDVVEALDEGVVVVDEASGTVAGVNAEARDVLGAVRVGAPAADLGLVEDAHGPGEIRTGDRVIRTRRVPLPRGRSAWFVRDVSDDVRRIDAVLAERLRARFLADCAARLGVLLHPDRTAAVAVGLAVPALADLAVLVTRGRRGRVRWWRAEVCPRPGEGRAVVEHGESRASALPAALRDLIGAAAPVPVRDADAPALLDGFLPAGRRAEDVVDAVAVALDSGGVAPAVLVLARYPDGRGAFDLEDWPTVDGFVQRCGLALAASATFAEQGRMAEAFRAHAAPPPLPDVPGVELGAALRHGQDLARVGGDFYQAWAEPNGGMLFAVGDVCGKGVPAAGLNALVRHTLSGLWRVERRPARLVHLLNDVIVEANENADTVRFVTGVVGRVTRGRGGLDVTLAGGGHVPPLVLRRDAAVEQLPLAGLAMGVTAGAEPVEHTVHLRPGETVVVVSDGVTEARGRGGEMFGTAHLPIELARCAGMPAAAVAERLEMLALAWAGGVPHDDVTVFVVQAPAARSARHLQSVTTDSSTDGGTDA
ncbi:hypothetical protein Val02_50640 [Virgisporangium aliadipatigenens]|uniref:PPM-type phosphatase domain-containing protein n=1 Tax=Virgisporangium aliadipatigenens TaxID=741659 RepID=A0A8J4DSS3_9ACTN|nr:PP2C family protein-serine/threonine phosphatase [Virgisporangium aliadipatigenens]GIJ48178.1 hypothetical protein Val02_50640 [Virgisporangium aliadipatigenens]